MVNKSKNKNISYTALSILIDQDGFSFYLHHTNPEDSILINSFEVEDLFNSSSQKLFKKQLKMVFGSYKFQKVKVAFANSYYAFVPKDYYVKEAKNDYIKYNVELFEEDQITSDVIESINVYQLYVPLMNYHNTIIELIDEFEYQHFTNFLIQDCQPKGFDNKNVINVCIRKSSIDIIAFEATTFKLCNTFDYDTDYDLAYYVLFALEELNFNQVEVELNIFHDSQNTSWLDILELYIKHINCHKKDLASFIK